MERKIETISKVYYDLSGYGSIKMTLRYDKNFDNSIKL